MSIKESIVNLAKIEYNDRFVRINTEELAAVQIPTGNLQLMVSGLPPIFREHHEQAIAFLIALNSINYMFWSLGSLDGTKHLFRYDFEGKVGAVGMRAAFDKVWSGESPWHQLVFPNNFRARPITPEFVVKHFGNIPDPQSRASLLSEVFAGDKLEQVSAALYQRIMANKAVSADDAELLQQAFPRAFNDPYYKRSQLAIFWIAGFFAECDIAIDTKDVTAFADYQVPRALRSLGILEYSTDLQQKVDSLGIIDAGSPEERAIRAATILACEELATRSGATAGEIDNFLWTNRNRAGATPFHLTFTEQY